MATGIVKLNRKFAFTAHWMWPATVLLRYFEFLNRDPRLLFYPFVDNRLVKSIMARHAKKLKASEQSDDVVDSYQLGRLHAETRVVRAFLRDYHRGNQAWLDQRIQGMILGAQQSGCDVVGLGALNKNEQLFGGGERFVRQLEAQGLLTARVVHGNTYTAYVVQHQALSAYDAYRIKSPVFLTGATSMVGRGVAYCLAQAGLKVICHTESYERFERIRDDCGPYGRNLQHSADLADGKHCHLWVVGKSTPSGKDLFAHMPHTSVALCFAVPDAFNFFDLRKRPDVIHLDGGMVQYRGEVNNMTFNLMLKEGYFHACHAGTAIHTHMGWNHHEVSQIDLASIAHVGSAGSQFGFVVSPPTNFFTPVEYPTVSLPPSNRPKTPPGIAA